MTDIVIETKEAMPKQVKVVMLSICCECQTVYGTREELFSLTTLSLKMQKRIAEEGVVRSHGYCPRCLAIVKRQLMERRYR
jgi:hypothetical protein